MVLVDADSVAGARRRDGELFPEDFCDWGDRMSNLYDSGVLSFETNEQSLTGTGDAFAIEETVFLGGAGPLNWST